MSVDFAKAAWLQYTDKNNVYFDVASLQALEALVKRCSIPAVSVAK